MKPIQIYIGNDETRDEAEMQEPVMNYWPTGCPKEGAYMSALKAYADHVATLKPHKVTGPHSWKVGQRLEEGVDFKYGLGVTIIEGYPTSPEPVIIPIEGDKLLNDFMSNVKYMRDSFRNGRISNAERWRDKLAEELDDIMRS